MSYLNEGVSVIMTFYNEKIEWIEQSINSIINQTHNNLELILVYDNPEYNSLFNKVQSLVHNNKK